jgi:hypothetical protein
MTRLVQVSVAGDITEAEVIQEMLAAAGIESSLEPVVDEQVGVTDESHLKVLVPEAAVEEARDAIEAMSETEDDELGP